MSFGTAYATKKKSAKFHHPDQRQKHERGVNTQDTDEGKRGESIAGVALRSGDKRGAKEMVRESISEAREMPKPALPMAEGGCVDDMQDADMIARIMHKRKEYAQGGVVANDVGVAEADESPAEFDDLVLRDDLDGAQPVDSNEEGDSDVSDDPIDRIMLKRKKDKLPRPA